MAPTPPPLSVRIEQLAFRMTTHSSNIEINTSPSRGASHQQVERAGEYFVAAELNKRGVYAVTFAGNMPKIDVLACNADQSRTVQLQVKTKKGGRSWHASIIDCMAMEEPPHPLNVVKFWIFVDLGAYHAAPRYWIVPDWWIRNDIYHTHQAYLNSHGGTRPRNPDSRHHAIDERRLEAWQARWEILGIFE